MWDGARVGRDEAWALSLQITLALGLTNVRHRPVNKYMYRPSVYSSSCTGEGNGNPLQCSCLENPGDGGAWWTAVYGVAQSRTRLK